MCYWLFVCCKSYQSTRIDTIIMYNAQDIREDILNTVYNGSDSRDAATQRVYKEIILELPLVFRHGFITAYDASYPPTCLEYTTWWPEAEYALSSLGNHVVRSGTDPDYRHQLNGFIARVTPEAYEKLPSALRELIDRLQLQYTYARRQCDRQRSERRGRKRY
jgi:hypothetical protein